MWHRSQCSGRLAPTSPTQVQRCRCRPCSGARSAKQKRPLAQSSQWRMSPPRRKSSQWSAAQHSAVRKWAIAVAVWAPTDYSFLSFRSTDYCIETRRRTGTGVSGESEAAIRHQSSEDGGDATPLCAGQEEAERETGEGKSRATARHVRSAQGRGGRVAGRLIRATAGHVRAPYAALNSYNLYTFSSVHTRSNTGKGTHFIESF